MSAAVPRSPLEPSPGDVVAGKYVIESLLGRGGMGVVYKARHEITDRLVAIKWLLEDDPKRRQRFLREAKAMGRLSHPNVVGVLDVGDHDGAIFLVMDYVQGKSLREVIDAQAPLSPEHAVQLLMPGLAGVAAAHQAGLLHRDLKPDNLFICIDRDGTAFDTKVLDFGVAKALTDEGQASLTHSGAIVGTPKYMAPEQLGEEGDLDPRCDVYALGLIAFEMVTGQLPYRSKTLNKLFLEILTADLPRADAIHRDVPEGLADVIARAMSRERDERFENVAAFAVALEPFGSVSFDAPRKAHTPISGSGSFVVVPATDIEPSMDGPRPALDATAPEAAGASQTEEITTQDGPLSLGASRGATAVPTKSRLVPMAAIGISALALIGVVVAGVSMQGGSDAGPTSVQPELAPLEIADSLAVQPIGTGSEATSAPGDPREPAEDDVAAPEPVGAQSASVPPETTAPGETPPAEAASPEAPAPPPAHRPSKRAARHRRRPAAPAAPPDPPPSGEGPIRVHGRSGEFSAGEF